MARAYSIEDDSGGEAADQTKICLQCGYELTGLGDEGICPECGCRFEREWVITGYKNRGGPSSNVAWGIAFLLFGSADLLITIFSNPAILSLNTLWDFMKDPCSIIGVVLLLIGFRGIATARMHGGNLRWVLTDEGIYAIRDNGSGGKQVSWSDVRRISIPFVFGIRPRRWRLLKVRRRWGASMDLFRKKTPTLWVKGKTRREMRSMARDIHRRFIDESHARGLDTSQPAMSNSDATEE